MVLSGVTTRIVRVSLILTNHGYNIDQKLHYFLWHSFYSTVSNNVFVFKFLTMLGMSALFFSKTSLENFQIVGLKEAV